VLGCRGSVRHRLVVGVRDGYRFVDGPVETALSVTGSSCHLSSVFDSNE